MFPVEQQLAWLSAIAGVAMFLLIAGPGSMWSFAERLLGWSLAATLLAASIPRLVTQYDPEVAAYARQIGILLMLVTRYLILLTSSYLIIRWAWKFRVPAKPQPVQSLARFALSLTSVVMRKD